MDIKLCYDIFGLQPSATKEEVKKRYRDLASEWHPDKVAHNPKLQALAQEELKNINAAYDILKSLNPSASVPPTTSERQSQEQQARQREREAQERKQAAQRQHFREQQEKERLRKQQEVETAYQREQLAQAQEEARKKQEEAQERERAAHQQRIHKQQENRSNQDAETVRLLRERRERREKTEAWPEQLPHGPAKFILTCIFSRYKTRHEVESSSNKYKQLIESCTTNDGISVELHMLVRPPSIPVNSYTFVNYMSVHFSSIVHYFDIHFIGTPETLERLQEAINRDHKNVIGSQIMSL